MAAEHLDVVIVGAGLSGVGTAHHLQRRHPRRTYAILEMRDRLGGTWDLFRYPGVRSDSDMHTLGYRFKPWTDAKAIADGPAILRYVRDTAREAGIDERIRFGHKVLAADWSAADACWNLDVERDGERVPLTCSWLLCCAGYYDYDQGFTPRFEGVERYRGRVVHPQDWPEGLDYADKRVVVVGSGATAVTLVPAMAERAAHVTMVQRSPTYVLPVPGTDPVAAALARRLPPRAAYFLTRWKNVALMTVSYRALRRWPHHGRKLIRSLTRRRLPPAFAIDTHFKPRYDPWDQRLCIVPDGDLFRALSGGRASVVTDEIAGFTETGLQLGSGERLPADVVVTATGLNMLGFGGMQLSVDGAPVRLDERLAYKGTMLSGVPNFAFALGYTNASWTLKVDLVAEHVCRLIAHMDARGMAVATPHPSGPVQERPLLDLQAGYVLRSLHQFPKQGSASPWTLTQNYLRDLVALRHGRVGDDLLLLPAPAARGARAPEPALTTAA